jgi:hypothetical protein
VPEDANDGTVWSSSDLLRCGKPQASGRLSRREATIDERESDPVAGEKDSVRNSTPEFIEKGIETEE